MRIGIMQGRLVPSATGELQCSPGPRWREEFSLAAALQLNHIELVADKVHDDANPVWSAGGRRDVLAVAVATGVDVASLCVNETLATAFDGEELALDLATRLAVVVEDLRLGVVVLPLLEASDLSVLDWSSAARLVRLLADQLAEAGASLVLELGVPAVDSLRFLEATASERVGLCYDVGNATSLGFDAAAELRLLGGRVWHVHAKDKDATGANVRFGTGNVRFAPVVAALVDNGFDGLVTMEATRGHDPLATAVEHRAFLLSLDSAARKEMA